RSAEPHHIERRLPGLQLDGPGFHLVRGQLADNFPGFGNRQRNRQGDRQPFGSNARRLSWHGDCEGAASCGFGTDPRRTPFCDAPGPRTLWSGKLTIALKVSSRPRLWLCLGNVMKFTEPEHMSKR